MPVFLTWKRTRPCGGEAREQSNYCLLGEDENVSVKEAENKLKHHGSKEKGKCLNCYHGKNLPDTRWVEDVTLGSTGRTKRGRQDGRVAGARARAPCALPAASPSAVRSHLGLSRATIGSNSACPGAGIQRTGPSLIVFTKRILSIVYESRFVLGTGGDTKQTGALPSRGSRRAGRTTDSKARPRRAVQKGLRRNHAGVGRRGVGGVKFYTWCHGRAPRRGQVGDGVGVSPWEGRGHREEAGPRGGDAGAGCSGKRRKPVGLDGAGDREGTCGGNVCLVAYMSVTRARPPGSLCQ